MRKGAQRTLYVLLVVAVVSLVAFTTYRMRQGDCVSHERGFRGEVMRQPNGEFVYFNGQCWTRQPVAPTDMPF